MNIVRLSDDESAIFDFSKLLAIFTFVDALYVHEQQS